MKQYHINIEGFENPKQFVETWSPLYAFGNEKKYNDHIQFALDNVLSFKELFLWKNGYGDGITNQKLNVINVYFKKIDILRQLRSSFNWELFEKEFQPAKSSTIWKIFLLHLINPSEFPIFDQHVFRFLNFQKTGKIVEISDNPKDKYEFYKLEYLPWFNKIKKEYQLDPKQMDQSFLSFGQLLKRLKGMPINITF